MGRRLRILAVCLPFFLAGFRPASAADWTHDLKTTAEWDSNATNANRSSDVIGALELLANFEFTGRISLGRDDALLLGGQVGVAAWPRFVGLDRAMLGPQLTWRHKFGLGAYAHVLIVELTGAAVAAHEKDRAGLAGTAAVIWRKRLDPATLIALSYAWAREDARAAVFDRTGREAVFDLARDLDLRWSLSFAARWREGDVLSYATPPRPDLVSIARARQIVDTFDDVRVAYSIDARTLGASLAVSHAYNDRTSLTFGYGFLSTDSGSLRYANHLVSVGLAHQF